MVCRVQCERSGGGFEQVMVHMWASISPVILRW